MRSTYKQLYYINRSKVKSDGTTSIMCRITIDGKAVVSSTGLYCRPEEWNSKKGEVKNNRLNGLLDEYKKRVDKTYAELKYETSWRLGQTSNRISQWKSCESTACTRRKKN